MSKINVYVAIQRDPLSHHYKVLVYRESRVKDGEKLLSLSHDSYRGAVSLVENIVKSKYHVVSVHDLDEYEELADVLFPDEFDSSSALKPKSVTYCIPIKQFQRTITEWFKKEKQLDVVLGISYEGPDDYGYLGDIYFSIDTGRTSEEVVDEITSLYGDTDGILREVLEDYFKIDSIGYDFNIDSLELHVFVPFNDFIEKHGYVKEPPSSN